MAQPEAHAAGGSPDDIWREIRSRHPRLLEALAADARVTALYRGERHEFRGRLDLARSACAWPGRATPSWPRRSTG